jgi:hypothetical protein
MLRKLDQARRDGQEASISMISRSQQISTSQFAPLAAAANALSASRRRDTKVETSSLSVSR